MKMKKYIFIITFLSFLISCMKGVDKHAITKKIDSANLMKVVYDNDYEIINSEENEKIDFHKCNEKIKSIKYIGLISDEPISDFYQIIVFDEKIYVLDINTEKIFIFGTNGKIVKVISDKGGGPKEYIGLGTMCISKTDSCLIVSDRLSMRLLYYSIEGNFLKKVKGIASCFIESYGDKIINQLDFGQSFSYDSNLNFHIVSTINDSILNKAFPLYPIHKNTTVYKTLSYNNKGDLLFSPLFSDTVYQILNDSVYAPKYVIKQKKSIWNKKHESLSVGEQLALIKNEQYTCLGKPFLETDYFIAYKIQISGGDVPFFASVDYYYDKTKKKSFYFSGAPDPITVPNFIPPVQAIYNNFFVGYISQDNIASIREWKKTHELYIENEEFRNLIESDVDWEGIIVMYELK